MPPISPIRRFSHVYIQSTDEFKSKWDRYYSHFSKENPYCRYCWLLREKTGGFYIIWTEMKEAVELCLIKAKRDGNKSNSFVLIFDNCLSVLPATIDTSFILSQWESSIEETMDYLNWQLKYGSSIKPLDVHKHPAGCRECLSFEQVLPLFKPTLSYHFPCLLWEPLSCLSTSSWQDKSTQHWSWGALVRPHLTWL